MLAVAVAQSDRKGKTRTAEEGGIGIRMSDEWLKEPATRTDDQIDDTDISGPDDAFWKSAKLTEPDCTQATSQQ
jgi:hypothetical protein